MKITSGRVKKIEEALYANSASSIKEKILLHVTLEELLFLALHQDERLAFRAAWFLEHILISDDPYLLLNNQNHILNIYTKSDNWSVLRSISKMIMELQKKAWKKDIDENVLEFILNKTFDILNKSECPIAVRCNAYDILFFYTNKEEWIKTELINQMQLDLEKISSAALVSRSRRILKKLR